MPTIKQLPMATSVNATDVLPISQGGTTKGLSVSQLLSSTQAALALASGKLLGRVSPTAGGPEPVGLGAGLLLDSGVLSATGSDHATLPLSTALSAGDEVVTNSGGAPRRMAATALRGLFSAGSGVSITDGMISATAAAYMLPAATTSALGGVKVDGRSVLIDGNGVISSPASSYTLPPATGTMLGGVKVDGQSVLVDGTGVISAVAAKYTLPAATTSALGGVKVDGRSVLVDGAGMISAVVPSYTLPVATVSMLGGVKVDGRSVLVDGSGVISATYALPAATTTALGGVKVDGRSVLIDGSGVISAVTPTYTLPAATTAALGGVKVDGRSVVVDGSGMISATYALPAATTTALGGVKVDGRSVLVDGSGVISAVSSTYTLPVATTGALGGVKVDGRSVLVDGSGVLSSVAVSIPLPITLGASGSAPGPITAVGASFAVQNGNIAATDVPGSPDAYDGLRSVLVLQPGSSVTQASALGGYALNRSVYATGTGKNAGVAVWGESVADVDGAQSWGMALSVHDGRSSGSGAGRVVTNEIDVGVNHAQTTAAGLKLSAAFSVQPGSADGYVVATSGSATDPAAARWLNGLYVRPGSASVAIRLGVTAGAGGLGSMPLVFESVDASGFARAARVAADLNGAMVVSGAGLTLQSGAGQPFALFSPSSGITLPAVTASGVSGSQSLVLTGRDASNTANSLQMAVDSGGNLQAKASGYSWQTGSGQEILNVGTGGVRVPPSATGNGVDSLLLLLTGRNGSGVLNSVTVKADQAGNGVVTAADFLFQITGAVRVNGAALLTTAAVPASGGLLATSGAGGAAQAATTAQFETLMTAWLQNKATAPSAMPGWWNNSGTPTYS